MAELRIALTGQSLIKRDIRSQISPDLMDILHAADLAFTNFEATIRGRHGGWPTKPGYVAAVEPVMLDVLRDLGFGALSLANNHAFDLGPAGVLSTLEEVHARGFLAAGIGVDATAAAAAGFLDLPPGRVALVAMDAGPIVEHATALDATAHTAARPGVNPLRLERAVALPDPLFTDLAAIEAALGHRAARGRYRRPAALDGPDDFLLHGQRIRRGPAALLGIPHPADRIRNLATIRAAKAQAQLVIAYVHHHHWEKVWEQVPDWMRGFARDCIDAGADLVASHGVPLVQGIELHRGRPIFHSLGNFIFHSADPAGWHHDDIWRSVVATCRFGASGALAGIELVPIVLGGEAALRRKDFTARDAPALAGADGPQLLAKIAALSAELGTSVRIDGGRAWITLD